MTFLHDNALSLNKKKMSVLSEKSLAIFLILQSRVRSCEMKKKLNISDFAEIPDLDPKRSQVFEMI